MPIEFDPSTATLDDAFDPSSAVLDETPGMLFDPKSAALDEDQTEREWRTGPLYEPARLTLENEQPQILPSPEFPAEDALQSAQESFAVEKPELTGSGRRERPRLTIQGLGVENVPELLLTNDNGNLNIVAGDGQRYDAAELLGTGEVTPESIGKALGSVEAAQILRKNKWDQPDWAKRPTEAADEVNLSRWQNAANAFGQSALGGVVSVVQATAKLDELINERMPTHSSREIIKTRQAMLDEAQKAVRLAYPLDPRYKDEFIASTLPSGAGSMLPFVLSGTIGGPIPSALVGSLMTAQQEYEAARAAGADEETARKSFGVGALIGTAEAFGVGRKGVRPGGSGSAGMRVLKAANEEGAQESLVQFLTNLNASTFTKYDPSRDPLGNVLESYAAGAILGGAVKIVGLSAEALERARNSEQPVETLREEIEQIQLPPEQPQAAPAKPAPAVEPTAAVNPPISGTAGPPDPVSDSSGLIDLKSPEGLSGTSFSQVVAQNRAKVDSYINSLEPGTYQVVDDTGEVTSEVQVSRGKSGRTIVTQTESGGDFDLASELMWGTQTNPDGSASWTRSTLQKKPDDYIPTLERVTEATENQLAAAVKEAPPESIEGKSARTLVVPEEEQAEVEAVEETAPEAEEPGEQIEVSPAPNQNRDAALESAYKIANDIADRVAGGRTDSVREAAFMAAFGRAQGDIEKSGNFNPTFMTAEAKRAAGDALKDRGESLDEDGETGSTPEEAQDRQTPEVGARRTEHVRMVREALTEFTPEEVRILMTAADEETQTEIAEATGVSRAAVSQRYKRLADKLKQSLIAKGMTAEEAISVGPGAANMAEFPERSATSTKNAVVDRERQDRGEEPIMAPAKQALGVAWQLAEDRIEADPNTGPALVAEILNNPRAVTNVEEAVLLHHKITVSNNLKMAMADMLDENASIEERESAGARVEFLLEEVNKIDEATKAVGTEWGRAGRFRQQLAYDDYTLVSMVSRARAAKGGEKLTAQEQAKIKAQHDKIQQLEKQIADLESKQKLEQEKATFANLIKEVQKEAKSAAKEGKTLLDTLKAGRDDALKNLRSKMGRTSAGVDPTILFDVARIGAYHIANGAVQLAEFTAKVIADVGEWIRPNIAEVFESAKGLHDANKSAFKKPGRKNKAAREAAADNAAKGNGIQQQIVYNLAREKVREGLKDLDAVIKAVHADLLPLHPGITPRDVRDAFSGYGKVKFPSKEEDLAKLRELRRLAQLASAIEDAANKVAPKKSGMQRDKPTQAVRDKMKELQKTMRENGIETSSEEDKLATANTARATALRNQIEDLDRQLKTGEKPAKSPKTPDSPEVERLRAERDAMKEELKRIEALENPKKSPEQIQLERDKSAIKRKIAEIQARIAAGDYAPRPKKEPLMDKEKERLLFEREKVKQEFLKGVFEEGLKRRTLGKKVIDSIREVLNTMRALKTSFDVSAVLRQGGFIAFAHPTRAIKSLPAMFRALASERGQFAAMQEIQGRKNAPLYARSKLYIADPAVTTLSKMEEEFMGRWASKIPGVAASQRAYITFLNKLRADSFDAMAATLSRSGDPSPEEARAIASFINTATGRASLPSRYEAGATLLNTIFFAPRYVASRFQLLALQPLYGGTARTRKLVATEYARYLTGVAVVAGLIAMARDDDDPPIETNPTSTDFLKIRFGNTRLDPFSGLQQITVFLSREADAIRKAFTEAKEKKPKYGTGGDVLVRFLRTKIAPVPGSVWNVLAEQNVVGQPVTPKSEALESIQPIALGEIRKIMEDQGVAKGSAIALLSLFGMSAGTYEAKKK